MVLWTGPIDVYAFMLCVHCIHLARRGGGRLVADLGGAALEGEERREHARDGALHGGGRQRGGAVVLAVVVL